MQKGSDKSLCNLHRDSESFCETIKSPDGRKTESRSLLYQSPKLRDSFYIEIFMDSEKNTPTNQTNVVVLPQVQYQQHINEIVQALDDAKNAGLHINPQDYIKHLDPVADNSQVAKWFHFHGLMTPTKFSQAMGGLARQQKIKQKLGFVPQNVNDFVASYVATHNITFNINGTINTPITIDLDGIVIDRFNKSETPEAEYLYNIAAARPDTSEDLRRNLRLESSVNQLGYSRSEIDDAVASWIADQSRRIRLNLFSAIKYKKGRYTGPEGQKKWADIERGCFDTSETSQGYAVAVLKKFIHQVKRKALGLPVTHHLMPVLTGAQEKGKSTFVTSFTSPLVDLLKNVDFKMVTDEKIIDIWSSSILFFDEMGGAGKSDAATVKNVITASTVTRRPMGSNSTIVVPQMATFIGCANESLSQLFRDTTGLRRFGELVWLKDPDWSVLQNIDWIELWSSVDENGPDPIIEADMTSMLKAQQSLSRNQSPTEVWARERGPQVESFQKLTRPDRLYEDYLSWVTSKFPADKTCIQAFIRNLDNLIQTRDDIGWVKGRNKQGKAYKYDTQE